VDLIAEREVISLGIVRGVFSGIASALLGIGGAALLRGAFGLPPWEAASVTAIGALTGVLGYLAGLGAFGPWVNWALGRPREAEEIPSPGWKRYLSFDTSHKVIGVQYAVTSLLFLLFGMTLAVLMRWELARPGIDLLNPIAYDAIMTTHGTTMLFLVVLPGLAGMINYLLPLMIGARDMAFPRLNALSFWVVPPAALLILLALLLKGPDTGWTAYAPLSVRSPWGMQFMLLGGFLAGFSSILGAVNFLTTIIKLRAPGMGLFRMPIFVWGVLAMALLSLTVTQFIAMGFLMVLLERLLGMGFFDPGMGGSVLLYQHLFWFYSHPAVYIFALPGLGVISELLPVFVRKPLFGYRAVGLASVGIAVSGTLVWGHHMFAAGIEEYLRVPFMITTLLVAVPTGVKIFSWLATLWNGKLRIATPILFVFSAIVVFLVGGLTGVFQAIIPTDLHITDTYWIVGHFHNTLFGGFLFPFLAAIYYWFPKVTGRLYREGLGRFHWGMMTAGFLAMTWPMFWLGMMGMRRRIVDYDPAYGPVNVLVSLGGFLVALSMVIFVYNLVTSLRSGPRAPSNPWGAKTLEWQVSSPPPEENFKRPPRVVAPPYGYGEEDGVHALLGEEGGDR
jgi:cytochrome c oxidase subunit 1